MKGKIVFIAIFILGGCQVEKELPPRVEGKVTLNGKGPLPGGTIQFVPIKGPHGAGMIRSDGSYEVLDPPLGECKVVISNENLERVGGAFITPSEKEGRGPGGLKSGENPALQNKLTIPSSKEKTGAGEKFVPIDPAYFKAETTPLRVKVTKGSQRVDFEVK